MSVGLVLSSRNQLLLGGHVVHTGVVDARWDVGETINLSLWDAFGNRVAGRQVVLLVALAADGSSIVPGGDLTGPVAEMGSAWMCLTEADGCASLTWGGGPAMLAVVLPSGAVVSSPVVSAPDEPAEP